MKKGRVTSVFLYGVLVFYILVMAWLLLFKNTSPLALFRSGSLEPRSVNLVPFRQIAEYFSSMDTTPAIALQNVLGNIVFFIPLGIYLPLFKRNKKIFANLFWVFITSALVGALQYALALGACDVDDIILNVLGGFAGILIYSKR